MTLRQTDTFRSSGGAARTATTAKHSIGSELEEWRRQLRTSGRHCTHPSPESSLEAAGVARTAVGDL
eukprot:2825899-Alexandrium_andersonii.AAC.1